MIDKEQAIRELSRRVEGLSEFRDPGSEFVSRLVIPALDDAMQPLALEIEGLHIIDDDIARRTLRATHYTSLETVLNQSQGGMCIC